MIGRFAIRQCRSDKVSQTCIQVATGHNGDGQIGCSLQQTDQVAEIAIQDLDSRHITSCHLSPGTRHAIFSTSFCQRVNVNFWEASFPSSDTVSLYAMARSDSSSGASES